jgi:MFS family permease
MFARNKLFFAFPFLMNVALALVSFVARHSLAAKGYSESAIGSLAIISGVVYIFCCIFMSRIITRANSRFFFSTGAIIMTAMAYGLFRTDKLLHIQILFGVMPFAGSMFFNGLQVLISNLSQMDNRPVYKLAGHYTFSWSIGFSAGYMATSSVKHIGSWQNAYFIAIVITLIIGLTGIFLKPSEAAMPDSMAEPKEADSEKGTNLAPVAWLGILIGWSMWNFMTVCWPVQATEHHFSPMGRILFEFLCMLVQGLGALVAIKLKRWQLRPVFLILFGCAGLAGILITAFANSLSGFLIGSSVIGIYTGSVFSFSTYHGMMDPKKAPKRIAGNEISLGLAIIAGPLCAALMRGNGMSFKTTYFVAAIVFAAGIIAQYLFAAAIIKKAIVET